MIKSTILVYWARRIQLALGLILIKTESRNLGTPVSCSFIPLHNKARPYVSIKRRLVANKHKPRKEQEIANM